MASNRKFNVPINLLNLASDPASADEGDIYYNTTSDVVRVYANGAWANIASGGSGISNVVEDTTPQLGGDLDAQGYNITNVEYIGLDTTPATEPSAAGSIWWSTDFETANLKLDSAVTLQIGQEHVIRVKNASGSVAIPEMTVVMFAGATGDTVLVAPAISTSAYEPEYLVGITTEEIPADGFGFVTQFGFVNQVDTSGAAAFGSETWSLGDLLYSDSAHPGYLTNVKPLSPNWKFPIAAVTRVNASSGRILVRAIPVGHLHDLTDVQISSPADNEVLAYNSANGTWINQTAAEAGLAVSGHTHTDNNTTYDLAAGGTTSPTISLTGSDSTTDTVTFSAGTNVSLSQSAGTITINATDTNTTYTAGTGLALNTTTFSLSHLGIQSLTDPNADRIMFWDDSAGAMQWLTLGTNLSISGTTLNATDTNTTYTAGTGLSLASTTFSVDTAVVLTQTNTLSGITNKTFSDSTTYIANVSDSTKKFDFNISQVTTGTTVTMWVGGGTAPASGMVSGDIWIPNA